MIEMSNEFKKVCCEIVNAGIDYEIGDISARFGRIFCIYSPTPIENSLVYYPKWIIFDKDPMGNRTYLTYDIEGTGPKIYHSKNVKSVLDEIAQLS